MSDELRDTVPRRVLPHPDRPDFRIHVIADDKVLARVLKGEVVAMREKTAAMKPYGPGEIVVGIPTKSIEPLTQSGWICEANGPDDVYTAAEMIRDHQLDVSDIEPSGRCGMICVADLLRAYPELKADGDSQPQMSKAAAALIAEHGLDPTEIVGSGGKGRITKPDVEAYLAEAVV